MSKCFGCGIELQQNDKDEIGYLPSGKEIEKNTLCQRCYQIKHYGNFNRKEIDNKAVINKINNEDKLVVFITDLISLNIETFPKGSLILVINKIDLVNTQINEAKLKSNIMELVPNRVSEIVLSSALKGRSIGSIYKRIMAKTKQKEVLIAGTASSGKTTFINKMIEKYGDSDSKLTTSYFPGTTLSFNPVEIDKNLTLIDTPGLESEVQKNFSKELLKKLHQAKVINPVSFQLKEGQSIVIEDVVKIDYVKGEQNSFTVFIPDGVMYHRQKMEKENDLNKAEKIEYSVENEDIVISGLGFIKIKKAAKVDIYHLPNLKIFKRKSLI